MLKAMYPLLLARPVQLGSATYECPITWSVKICFPRPSYLHATMCVGPDHAWVGTCCSKGIMRCCGAKRYWGMQLAETPEVLTQNGCPC